MIDWPAIVEEHGPSVWRTAFRLLSDREEANECYQETFLNAVEYSNKREVTNWPGLLKRIATSRALDRLRRRYQHQTELLEDSEFIYSRELAPDQPLQYQEWMDQFHLLVAGLPERQADVFWMSEIEKMEHQEIAMTLQTTSQQVATWLHRAKQKLRQVLVERGIANEVKQ